MKLGICITHYKEPAEVVEPLLRSIELQQGIDLNCVEVVVVNDGDEGVLPDEFFEKFSIPNLYRAVMPKGNISKARNFAMSLCDTDYVMFCDCDDMFLSLMGLRLVFSAMNEGYDFITSSFVEETYINGEYKLIRHDKDITFIHGKAYKTKFLNDNDIHFNESLYIHEDGYFNSLVNVVSESQKNIEAPFYLWRWNEHSTVRENPDNYLLRTYGHLIRARIAACDEFFKRGYIAEGMDAVAKTVLDAYYDSQKPDFLKPENAKLVKKAEHEFKKFYNKYGKAWKECNVARIGEISYLCRALAYTHGLRIESQSVSEWLAHIVNDIK